MSAPSLAYANTNMHSDSADPNRADMQAMYAARYLRTLREYGLSETAGTRELFVVIEGREKAAYARGMMEAGK